MGSDFVQGYFYYRPLAPEAAEAVLAEQGERGRRHEALPA
jgi:EAL domain-containing protein (putative c-di-GMP-specific phosphodiesterase class I)